MKKSITLVLALLTAVSFAQPYNRTYDINANADNLSPAFVITDPANFESITVSYGSNGGAPQLNYFILTRNQPNGNTVYNNVITSPNAPIDGFTNVEALINTDDGGTLVAGYWYKDYTAMIEQPFLLKVNAAGVVQWIRIYMVNQRPIVNAAMNKISLCRVANESIERYFIVAASNSDRNPNGQDVAVNVIKVENNGQMIWSNKYYDVTLPSPYIMKREYPGDMEYNTIDRRTFMITGYREDSPQPGAIGRSMFFFAIDNTGAVITPFMTLISNSVPIDQDMVFDPNQLPMQGGIFTTVFTHDQNTYVPGVPSVMGFISIDPAVTTPMNPTLLWHANGTRHNGRSISLATQGNYLLCLGVFDPQTQLNNPAWLKVNGVGNPIPPFQRYNVADNVFFGHHAVSALGGNEQYVLVNEQKTDLRIIRTLINGNACGVRQYPPLSSSYSLQKMTFSYRPESRGDWFDFSVRENRFIPQDRTCFNNAPSYRTAGVVSLSGNPEDVKLYPSLIQKGNAILTVENNTGAVTRMEVRSISGQLIFVSDEVAAGKTDIKLNDLSQGIYLVQIQDANNTLISAQKIIVTE